MKIRIEPYKTWSGGAKRLGLRAGILRATRRQVEKHGDFDTIINWGRSERRFNGQYINDPEAVARSGDKLRSFELFADGGVPCPEFTTDRNVAQGWLNDGSRVVVRKLLRASAGRGIVLVEPDGTGSQVLPAAPLYVRYVKKAEEYRVHIAFGEVIDVQQKKRNLSVPDDEVNWQIRNHKYGWIFARDDVDVPSCVVGAALRAVDSLDLDFGAVDCGYNRHKDEAVVYEVNTAPGLEGSSLDIYYEAFKKRLPQIQGGFHAKRRTLHGYQY